MTLILTSNIIKNNKLTNDNNFINNLKKYTRGCNKLILVSASPNEYEKNDNYLELDKNLLENENIVFDEYIVLDNRNKKLLNNIITNKSFVILSGGDTYKQNKFINEIKLKEIIKIAPCVLGISAGTINSANIAYNSPECIEYLNNPCILEGLDLTNINVEPHFNINNENTLQMEAIKKYKNTLYGLVDYSYIINNTIYGECYKIKNGKITKICENNKQKEIKYERNN